ncbi:hypothetical protein L1889_12725 [Paenalcaligenes niemegkensis]|uniref:hypothetical protein n=1 Tax=Paenalcaligenes niemegkensis TaxID=2895469 RepID=UPI001EE7F7BA|nr:hypothetical protein [Paenalcaligenes niemegkensis]MCQ9617446.1 hypothetical protein [Paenalcaligenes niemegkensis]
MAISTRSLEPTCQASGREKIVIEAETLDEAHEAMAAGADIIQFDKVSRPHLEQWCSILRDKWPHIKILAAGGINLSNVQEFAASGVDALVTSSVYFGSPADIGVELKAV